MRLAWSGRLPTFVLHCLIGVGAWLARQGHVGRAVELFALVHRHRLSEKRDRDEAQRQLEALRERLSSEGLAEAQDRAQGMKLEEVVQELLDSSFEIEAADSR